MKRLLDDNVFLWTMRIVSLPGNMALKMKNWTGVIYIVGMGILAIALSTAVIPAISSYPSPAWRVVLYSFWILCIITALIVVPIVLVITKKVQ